MNRDFETIKDYLLLLCEKFSLPEPKITLALSSDPCDYTDHKTIRVNLQAAPGVPLDYHARHVFGHYLCELHQTDLADHVADILAEIVTHPYPPVKHHRKGRK